MTLGLKTSTSLLGLPSAARASASDGSRRGTGWLGRAFRGECLYWQATARLCFAIGKGAGQIISANSIFTPLLIPVCLQTTGRGFRYPRYVSQ
jgi:hypothetical protein